MKVLKTSERIRVNVKGAEGEFLFSLILSPLSYEQKSEIQNCRTLKEGQSRQDGLKAVKLALKYSLKGIEGFENSDGSPYMVELDETKTALADSCIDDILNTERAGTILIACSRLIDGVYKNLVDADGKVIEGIEVVLPGEEKKI